MNIFCPSSAAISWLLGENDFAKLIDANKQVYLKTRIL